MTCFVKRKDSVNDLIDGHSQIKFVLDFPKCTLSNFAAERNQAILTGGPDVVCVTE